MSETQGASFPTTPAFELLNFNRSTTMENNVPRIPAGVWGP